MRALRVLVILVVVFGGLFVAADRLAVNFAEDKAAEKIRGSQGLDKAPDVSIKGFPFLTQVAGRSLDEVDAKLDGIRTSSEGKQLRIQELSAQFHDVKLTSDFSSIESAARATGTAHISYADLTKAAGADVEIGYAGQKNGNGQVKIVPRLAGLPALNSLEVTGTVTVVDRTTIQVRADHLPSLCLSLPGCESKVRERTDHSWKLDRLPGGLKLDRVEASPDGVKISASGTNVKITG
ncbi:DUF2993 domain-containing protein [Streptomyces sp. NPDC003077]|uniref:LmeA family phospholipid-binding protein n=1 Tax=Streptomyces sp. NPDC003077 TaxID=3154443 RepID=UPI0033B7E97F